MRRFGRAAARRSLDRFGAWSLAKRQDRHGRGGLYKLKILQKGNYKMKHLTKWIGKLLFVVMAIALITYAASRTLDFENSTLGAEDQIIGYLALFATTGGALAWLAVFLWNSKGIAQKGISLVMVIIDVLGEIALFTIDTLLQSGTNGLTATLAPEEIRLTVLGMSFLIGLNIIATFAFHIMDEENIAAIEKHFRDQKVKAANDKIEQAITDAKVARAESIAVGIATREADVYAQVQKAQDRRDHTLPERGIIDTLKDVKAAFSGNGAKREDLPIAAAETVAIPELTEAEKGENAPGGASFQNTDLHQSQDGGYYPIEKGV